MNGIEAMAAIADRPRERGVESRIYDNRDVPVAIRDSCCGLGSEANRIFDPFFTTKANGMGMGLSNCRTVTNNHGSRLSPFRNCPHCTVFWFALQTSRESPS
jgi:C4-dicarboxylate-specific signal transduction histidine kinase